MNSEFDTRITFGLTGIMGSGKSTVAKRLALKGAVVISEDEIVKGLQNTGSSVLKAMTTILGKQILNKDNSLDRRKTAHIIFADATKRQRVEAIIHPLVVTEIMRMVKQTANSKIILLDASVLLTRNKIFAEHIIHIHVPQELAVKRLDEQRGLSVAESKKRVSMEILQTQIVNSANYVINNAGSYEDLEMKTNKLWKWMSRLSSAKFNERC